MMNVELYTPNTILRPFIKAFMLIESGDGMVNKILPDTAVIMALRYQGTTYAQSDSQTLLPACAVSGLTKSARLIGYAQETAALLVVFREGGVPAFSGVPLHELFGLHLSLEHFIRRQTLDAIGGRLAEAKHNKQRLAIVEQLMLSELREMRPDPLVLRAVQKIKRANGDIRVKELAVSLSISQDAFEKRFNRLIGTSPKQFAKIVRFRSLIKNYPQAKNLTDVALRAGYFDQAHFIKDFTAFTGVTPKDFFSAPSSPNH